MAASIKISELNSLTNLTDVDLFLVSDMETGTSRKISYNNLKSNVTSDLTSAVSDLTNVVSQNKTSAETLVETVRAALQASVNANATNFGIADSDLDYRIDFLEQDPTTKAYVDAQIASVSDNAPENLDTLNELAAALGDNPNLVSGLDTRVTTLEASPILDTTKVSISGAGGVTAPVGFFTGGALTVGGNASLTGNATFSGGVVNFTNGLKIDGDALTSSATELNFMTGVTSPVQTQINSINTTISNLEIDIAPETLDSINELAAALGDDPQIIPNLQAELTAYKAHIEARNLEQGLAFGELYADTLTVG